MNPELLDTNVISLIPSLKDIYFATDNLQVDIKIVIVCLLVAFLPCIAFTFFATQREQRQKEIQLILTKLKLNDELGDLYSQNYCGSHLFLAVMFTTSIAFFGLTSLFLGHGFKALQEPNFLLGGIHVTTLVDEQFHVILEKERLKTQQKNEKPEQKIQNLKKVPDNVRLQYMQKMRNIYTYQQQALLVFSMAFLGAYLWGLQYLLRRYFVNDLVPGAFYNLGVRMIFSAVIALLIFHIVALLSTNSPDKNTADILESSSQLVAPMLPALAFFIGMFPQKGVKWLSQKITIIGSETHPSVVEAPLGMIEGIEEYHIQRLAEIGIDSCYNLAQAEFIPLILKTPYQAREVLDWLLQAKLCIHFGADIKVLRQNGFRTIIDLADLDDDLIGQLARDTSLTELSLKKVSKIAQNDPDLKRLIRIGIALGHYLEINTLNQLDKT